MRSERQTSSAESRGASSDEHPVVVHRLHEPVREVNDLPLAVAVVQRGGEPIDVDHWVCKQH